MRPAVIISSNTLHYGGAERQRIQLANGLAERGWAVTLALLQDEGPLRPEVCDGVSVLRTPWWAPRPDLSGPAVLVTGTTNTECAYGLIWRRSGALRGRLRRWIVAEHTAAEPDGPTHTSTLARLIRLSDRVIALSPSHWRDVTAHQRLHARPALLIPNGVVAGPPCARSRRPGPLRLAFVGRLIETKGLSTVLTALEGMPGPCELDVYGDGPHRMALEQSVPAVLRSSVRFHGFVPHRQIDLVRADLLVLPSRREALPMVLLEAMATGVPVMASPTGAVPELLADGAGILVPSDDVVAWRSALCQVLASPDTLLGLGERGRCRVAERYTITGMVEGYEAALVSTFRS